jgi:hypothetical protein
MHNELPADLLKLSNGVATKKTPRGLRYCSASHCRDARAHWTSNNAIYNIVRLCSSMASPCNELLVDILHKPRQNAR